MGASGVPCFFSRLAAAIQIFFLVLKCCRERRQREKEGEGVRVSKRERAGLLLGVEVLQREKEGGGGKRLTRLRARVCV